MGVVKQVIVVRTKYPDGRGGFFKPRAGKLMAQAAHASLKVFLDRLTMTPVPDKGAAHDSGPSDAGLTTWICMLTPEMVTWMQGIYTKICVGTESEASLLELASKAQMAGLPYALIQDHGLTEFKGVPTYTCLAIGPAVEEQVDLITGCLPLL